MVLYYGDPSCSFIFFSSCCHLRATYFRRRFCTTLDRAKSQVRYCTYLFMYIGIVLWLGVCIKRYLDCPRQICGMNPHAPYVCRKRYLDWPRHICGTNPHTGTCKVLAHLEQFFQGGYVSWIITCQEIIRILARFPCNNCQEIIQILARFPCNNCQEIIQILASFPCNNCKYPSEFFPRIYPKLATVLTSLVGPVAG
jgi:hypothetical protein